MADPRGYDYPSPIDGYDLLKLCIAIPDDPTYRRSFFGHLTYLMHPTTWNQNDPDEAELAADYWTRIIYDILVGITDCSTEEQEPTVEIVERIIERFIGGADCTDESEKENEMALQIQNIGGIDYLVETCCGGQTRHYQLSRVEVDSTGAPISTEDGGDTAFKGTNWDGTVTDANLNCYGSDATTYLLRRAEEWAHTVIDWTSLAGDAFFANADEILDAALLTADLWISTPNLAEIQELTKSEVSTALFAEPVTTALSAAWTYTGSITKNDLRQWSNSAPWFNGVTPVRLVIQAWIDYSLLIGLNRGLQDIAAQCEAGLANIRDFDFTQQSYIPVWRARIDDTPPPEITTEYTEGVGWSQVWQFAAQIFISNPLAFTTMRIHVGGDANTYDAQFSWWEFDSETNVATNERNLTRVGTTNVWEWTGAEAIVAQILTTVDNSGDDAIIERIEILE